MTLILEIPAEVEREIRAAAEAAGTDVAAFMVQAAQREARSAQGANAQSVALTEKRMAIEKGFGFLKGRIPGSDAFLTARHAEAESEFEKDSVS